MSKTELSHRWHREGRLESVRDWMDGERVRLRQSGKSRQEAREGAWEAAVEEFPPLPIDNGVSGRDPISNFDDDPRFQHIFQEGGTPNIRRDFLWVYRNLTEPDAIPPSPGALTILSWAKESPGQFCRVFLSKVFDERARRGDYGCQAKRPEKLSEERIQEILQPALDEAMNAKSGVISKCPNCGNEFEVCAGDLV